MNPVYGISFVVENTTEFGFNHVIFVKQDDNTLCKFYATTRDLAELKEEITKSLNRVGQRPEPIPVANTSANSATQPTASARCTTANECGNFAPVKAAAPTPTARCFVIELS